MTSDPASDEPRADRIPPDQELLAYRQVPGEDGAETAVASSEADPAPDPLLARSLRLADGRQVRQLLARPAAQRARQQEGYQRIDNEILAGIRLARLARGRPYPPETSRLIGYAADSATPYALLEPYRGEPTEQVAGKFLRDDLRQFMLSLLTGLRWLAEARIAHCGIGPSTVRWDGQHVQITDFSRATIIGVRQDVIDQPAWAQLPTRTGRVSQGDDILAAGLLIYYVLTGEVLADGRMLAEVPDLSDQLEGVFRKDPDLRPSAHELLTERMLVRDPVPRGLGADPLLKKGRQDFSARRKAKHPELGQAELSQAELSQAELSETDPGRGERDAPPPPPPPPKEEEAGSADLASGTSVKRRRLPRLLGGLMTMLAVTGLIAGTR